MLRVVILLVWFALPAAVATASDMEREKQFAIELTEALLVGEAVTLQAESDELFAIHTEAEDESLLRGGAILLHGRGTHPNSSTVIWPLRTYLPQHAGSGGAEYEPLIPEAVARINAAVEFLRQREIKKIVLIGHSLGARMAAEYLAAAKPPKEIIGWVAIGIMLEPEGSESKTSEALSKIELPTLDIYGSRDLKSVLNSVTQRKLMARRAENKNYRQDVVLGADHYFRELDAELDSRVAAWMAKIEKMEQTERPPSEEPAAEK